MRHNGTFLGQAGVVAGFEQVAEYAGAILFLDEQHLTRDCISRELSRRLPEFTITECARACDLTKDDPGLAELALVILYVHADRMILQQDGENLDHGIAAQLSILEDIAPEIPRVLMSEVEVPDDILEAFRRRVRGYVPTALPISQVTEAIRFVAAGGTFVPLSILSMHGQPGTDRKEPADLPAARELAYFSPRQNEVLKTLWNGSSNKVIAYQLRMSESTVKVHIRHIMKKLHVNNRTQVVLRTHPQRVEDSLSSSRLGSSSLQVVKAIATFAEVGPGPKASARSLDLSKELGIPNSSHRG